MTIAARGPRQFRAACGFALIAVIALADYVTGFRLSFAFFYIVPIVLIVRATPWPWGMVAAVLSFAAWFLADFLARTAYPAQYVYIWNCLARLAFFMVVAYLERRRQDALGKAEESARNDPLTGLLNVRAFRDAAALESERCRRYGHPFSLAYIDLDNFKAVNDQEGHSAGDRALQEVAASARETVRPTDLLARVGGDEFVVLMPETDSGGARKVLERLRAALLAAMTENGWPITFSMGATTFVVPPGSVDEMIGRSDALMYRAKKAGKNMIWQDIMDGRANETAGDSRDEHERNLLS